MGICAGLFVEWERVCLLLLLLFFASVCSYVESKYITLLVTTFTSSP